MKRQIEAEAEAAPRILVLGSSGHSRLVSSYEWDKLPKGLNVSDFDKVILNFVPLKAGGFAQSINADRIPDSDQFSRLIFSTGSEVIAIGSPNFAIGNDSLGIFTKKSDWWLPVVFSAVYQTGETTQDVNEEFDYYFDLVRRWSFYFHEITQKQITLLRPYASAAASSADNITLTSTPLANTRFHAPIGVQLSFSLERSSRRIKESGTVIWLPEPTEVSSIEAINLILSRRYGLHLHTEPPQWARNYSLPAEIPIIDEINKHESAIKRLASELESARRKLRDASRFKEILYEQGEDVLEPLVRDALRELGAAVDDPKQRGKEDGRLIDQFGRNAMLEIKGRTGNLRLSDARELDQWVRDALAYEEWESKGILIVNLQCEQDPQQRTDFIPSNCEKFAKRVDLSIVTTSQLFQALISDQQGMLDRKQFWDDIFAGKGLCLLPDLSQSKAAA